MRSIAHENDHTCRIIYLSISLSIYRSMWIFKGRLSVHTRDDWRSNTSLLENSFFLCVRLCLWRSGWEWCVGWAYVKDTKRTTPRLSRIGFSRSNRNRHRKVDDFFVWSSLLGWLETNNTSSLGWIDIFYRYRYIYLNRYRYESIGRTIYPCNTIDSMVHPTHTIKGSSVIDWQSR